MQTNNISFKASLNVSDYLKYKSGKSIRHLNSSFQQISRDFTVVTKDYPRYNLEASALDISGKEVQFKLKVGEKVEASGFYDFGQNNRGINISNIVKVFNDLRSKAVSNKSLKYLQEWYAMKLAPLKNDTSIKLDEINSQYSQRLKIITQQREKEQKLYKLEV